MMTLAVGLPLILQVVLTTATVYHYNETSEEVPYVPDPDFLSGFRNIINKDFIIGGLFPIYPCTNPGLNNLETLEAMLFAIDRINNDMNLLPNLTIGYDVRDTSCDIGLGLYEAIELHEIYVNYMSTLQPATFLGIVGPAISSISHLVATVFGSFQIPLISYGSSNATLSNKDLYGYFLRTIPSNNLQTNATVSLVSHFRWEYVSMIFGDDEYGNAVSNAFIDGAEQNNICIDARISIPSSSGAENNRNLVKTAVRTLLNSTASVVIVFANESTVLTLFEELNKTNSTRKFVWIASDTWANSQSVYTSFPEIANGTFGFQLYTKHVQEFDDYFSQLNSNTNIRNPFFHDPQHNHIYNGIYCEESGSTYNCPADDLTAVPGYSQDDMVPLVIDAVYAFAHALHNFLDYNCDDSFRWNRTAQGCDGMKNELNGETLLGYIFNVSFNGMQNHTVSFDENGDPTRGVYKITYLQINESGHYEYVSVGFWNSAYEEYARLILNNTNGIKKRCSDPCSEGMIRSITNQNCTSCFECVPCVGPTYSMDSSAHSCSLCSNNHWGNNPLSGSTHCVQVKVQNFGGGWSITAMCIASIALIILAVITFIFLVNWKTPVVKSSGREQMIMLLVGIGVCCVLTFVVVAPPSTAVCIFQRIGAWFCFSLAFGALLVKIICVARIFYWHESAAKRPLFMKPKYQVMFTLGIVAVQIILVAIGLGINPPDVKMDPDVVVTSAQQTGDAPEIVETCQQPHAVITVLSLVYNFFIIVGCTILGWVTRKFPENYNEARHVMFTSFTLMVVWVLFVPLYFSTENEFQTGILALGIVLSAIALMAGVFFPRVYILVFQKHKNTIEYAKQQNHMYVIQSTKMMPFQQNAPNESIATSKFQDDTSPDKGNSTIDSGVVAQDVKMNAADLKGKDYQPAESNTDSTTV